jgi:hypothetical protein
VLWIPWEDMKCYQSSARSGRATDAEHSGFRFFI